MASFSDHFSAIAARYVAYRPLYPADLVGLLADRCERCDVAWDIGCGSGQLSVALAARFGRVIATDPARAQLDHAEAHPRVEYRCAPAEASGLPDAGVDLGVAAQSAHWFDWPRFVVEAGRVVRPGGLIALVSYRNAELAGDAGALLAGFYRQLDGFWPDGRGHVDSGYRALTFPWPTVAAPPIDPTGGLLPPLGGPAGRAVGVPTPLDLASPIEMTARWTRDELFGYITTWSATGRLVAVRGEAPLDEMRARLVAVWPGDERREVRWPLTVKLTRR